jgi:L-fuculose-phosphate aldolase
MKTTLHKSIFREFQKFGSLLWQRGLISYQAGNMSILHRDTLFIKRRGAPLGFLKPSDIIKASLEGELREASSELPTHQAIYKKTGAKAIIHCHPPHGVILSFLLEEIKPIDTEAPILIGERIPVVTKPLPDEIAEVLKTHKIVIVKGHGSFARGESLEEAFSITTTLEHSCYIYWAQLLLWHQNLIKPPEIIL